MNICSTDIILNRLRNALVDSFLKVFGDSLVSLVLFGSYARGEPRPDSDIDLLVVLDRVSDRYAVHRDLDRVENILEPLFKDMDRCGSKPFLSPIVLSREQASVTRSLYLDLVFDAVILYDRDSFMSSVLGRLREKLATLGAERKRIGSKWVVVLKKDYRFGEVIEI